MCFYSPITQTGAAPKPPKSPLFGFALVNVTEKEKADLERRFGSKLQRMADILQNYKESTGKKYKSDAAALRGGGQRVKRQIVTIDGYEPVRLLHCPYKGYDEFIDTRCSERPSVCRRQLFIRKGNTRFLKWLEKDYERQTA